MTDKQRKGRIDSSTEAVAVMLKATQSIVPPSHTPLDADAEPFWSDIIDARAKSEWTSHDLAYAADLANTMAQLAANRRLLRGEGEIIGETKPYANPRVAVVHGLHAQVKSARQSLNIHGRASGEARDVGKRRAAAREIEKANPLMEDDDLLARPLVQ